MCQAKPGPRCYSDSCATALQAKARLDKEKEAHAAVVSQLDAAMNEMDFAAYAKAHEVADEKLNRVIKARVEKRNILRDKDGTKTGVRLLEKQLEECTSDELYQHLVRRRRSSNVLRPIRKRALEIKSGAVPRPLLALPGEHIRERKIAVAA